MITSAVLELSTSRASYIVRNLQTRLISTSQSLNLNQKWRRERGLPLNPNANGVLTDGQDYSFLDGRPTPYGVRQKDRIVKQQEIAKKIIELTAEVDFAVNRYNELQKAESDKKQAIIDGKLKPKGVELLKKKK